MPKATYHLFESVPPAAEAAVAGVVPIVGALPSLYAPERTGEFWFGLTDRHFVYLGGDEEGRARVRLEVRRTRWAAERGLLVPALVEVAEDGSWAVSERVRADPAVGPVYVDAAVDAATRIASLPMPPPEVLSGSLSRRAPRRGRVLRAARLLAGGLNLAEFARVRRAADALPATRLAHGDFHPNNVLFDEPAGAVHLTDFELLGPAAEGSDLFLMWQTLDGDEDRDRVLDAVVSGTGPEQRRRLGVTHLWIALRTLAERLALPAGEREPDQIEEARRLVRLARRNAGAWGAV